VPVSYLSRYEYGKYPSVTYLKGPVDVLAFAHLGLGGLGLHLKTWGLEVVPYLWLWLWPWL
jgi:hypothetical protein